jgi:trimethylguanosine synthase
MKKLTSTDRPSAIAKTLAGIPPTRTTIVDLFAGIGGNTLSFALATPARWARIIAVERDRDALACARRNAALRGVAPGRITWVCADSLADFLDPQYDPARRLDDLAPELRLDLADAVLFASPPWGGPSYRRRGPVFDLEDMQPYRLSDLAYYCQDMPCAFYLPRTADLRQIAALVPDGATIQVRQYCLHGASKALVAYMPEKAAFRRGGSSGEDAEGADGADGADGAQGAELDGEKE